MIAAYEYLRKGAAAIRAGNHLLPQLPREAAVVFRVSDALAVEQPLGGATIAAHHPCVDRHVNHGRSVSLPIWQRTCPFPSYGVQFAAQEVSRQDTREHQNVDR